MTKDEEEPAPSLLIFYFQEKVVSVLGWAGREREVGRMEKTKGRMRRRTSSATGISPAEVSADKSFSDALLQRIESWTYVADEIIPFIKGRLQKELCSTTIMIHFNLQIEMLKIERAASRSYAKLGSGLELKASDQAGTTYSLTCPYFSTVQYIVV